MVRHYKKKDARLQWGKESMQQALKAVTDNVVSTLGAAELFQVPYTSLYRKVQEKRKETCGENAVAGSPIGRPSVFNSDMEKTLAQRVKYLESRGFGVTPKQLGIAAYSYATKCGIETPSSWSENKTAGNDWYLAFCKRNNLSLRKPEALSKARAAGVNKEAVTAYFEVLGKILDEFNLCNQPTYIYNMDESGLPLNNRPPKVIAEKGKREVVSLTSVERGENVTIVACCNASGNFIPPLVIFKGVRQRPELQDSLPTGAVACMSDSGYINEDIFLKFLEHFQKHRAQGRVLLIVDGHTSHSALPALEFCQQNEIEMLCLPPHATHVLQPLDRTVFKSLKANYHKEATAWMHRHPGSSISKFQFCSLFKEAWNRTASVGLAVKGFSCTGIYPYRPQAIEEFRFAPSETYDGAIKDPISSPSPGPSTWPDDSPLPSTVQETTLAQFISTAQKILPSPEKVTKKVTPMRTKKPYHSTSPENIGNVKAKRELQLSKSSSKLKRHNATKTLLQDSYEAGPSKKVSSVQVSYPSDEKLAAGEKNDSICGFCAVNYYSDLSTKKGDWIQCQRCKTWFHEQCVGAKGRKQFICGRCV